MHFLDFDALESLDARAFRRTRPYPWLNPVGALTEPGFRALSDALPDLSLFRKTYDVPRKYGQAPHNRYALKYAPDLPVDPAWHDFVAELSGSRYRDFVARMIGSRSFALGFHWHLAARGSSVSPHCDSMSKLGSHLFYLNRSDEWDPAWGGETLVLDDGGRISRRSAPGFDDFDAQIAARCMDNASFLFARGRKSWHGVREITCPEGSFRKVFIVVFRRNRLIDRSLSRVTGKPVAAEY